MASTFPPRYLPTLTEVVAPAPVLPDSDPVTLSLEIVRQVTPLVEQKLRVQAHQQLDQQIDALLPNLHQQIESAVRSVMQELNSKSRSA